MRATLCQLAGLVLVTVGAYVGAGVAGGLVGSGITLVYVGLSADRGGV